MLSLCVLLAVAAALVSAALSVLVVGWREAGRRAARANEDGPGGDAGPVG